MRGGVVMEFCREKELYPFSRVVGAKDVEISFKLLIGLLSLSISLRMVGSGEANIIFEETNEFLSKGGGELRALVGDESIVTVLFPDHSVLLFFHTQCLLTWRGRRIYTNTAYLFLRTASSFCFFDLSMDLANS